MSDNATRRRMMVDNQIRPSDVTKFPIIEAFLSVKREYFVPTENRDTAYVGEHIQIGNDRVILDPRTLAKMLDALYARFPVVASTQSAANGWSRQHRINEAMPPALIPPIAIRFGSTPSISTSSATTPSSSSTICSTMGRTAAGSCSC